MATLEPPPTDKAEQRAHRNFLSGTIMLGHLCALYDRGVWEAARLMSNLLFQLAIRRRSNTPLLAQTGLYDDLRIVVDANTRGATITPGAALSPLVDLTFGVSTGAQGTAVPVARWVPAMLRPNALGPFDALSVDAWLDELVVPTAKRLLSRRELIDFVRDQDGGAHSDPDAKLLKSEAYLDLVNVFPVSKASEVMVDGCTTRVWDLLPPVTMPILRQIAHEMLCAIYSQSDVRVHAELPCLVCLYQGVALAGAFVPERYPDIGLVHGRRPAVIQPRRRGGD